MRINKKWLKTDFEQKYFKLTNKCEFNVKRVGSDFEVPYICRVIKIEEIDGKRTKTTSQRKDIRKNSI